MINYDDKIKELDDKIKELDDKNKELDDKKLKFKYTVEYKKKSLNELKNMNVNLKNKIKEEIQKIENDFDPELKKKVEKQKIYNNNLRKLIKPENFFDVINNFIN